MLYFEEHWVTDEVWKLSSMPYTQILMVSKNTYGCYCANVKITGGERGYSILHKKVSFEPSLEGWLGL